MPFVHQVWLQWRPEASAAQIAAFGDAVLALKGAIPEIVSISFGANVTQRTPHSHGLCVVFARAEHLAVYDQHPAHQAVVKAHVLPLKQSVAALDFECAAPLSGAGRFSHHVWFDFAGATEEQIAAAQEGLLGMKATVPGSDPPVFTYAFNIYGMIGCNSLWTERFKCGASPAVYWWSSV